MRNRWILWLVVLVLCLNAGDMWIARAQEAPATVEEAPSADEEASEGMNIFTVIARSGPFGVLLWLLLLASSMAGLGLVIDSFITIRQKKIVPDGLVSKVKEAMEQGDLTKAMQFCDEEPGPLANVLSAGFSNVEEGFEAIQDSVGVAADLESERLLQRVTYLNLVGNLSPMLGLLGTVSGMISAFQTLGLGAGGAGSSLLALNISQALYTTAAGLFIAVPAIGFFYFFRNRATNIILHMESLTIDLIKVLRNVEVIAE